MTTTNMLGALLSRPRGGGGGALVVGALFAATLIAAPILGVVGALFEPVKPLSARLLEILLPRYVATTAELLAYVAVGVTALGVGAAWLVTFTRFWGRGVLEVGLALPLAFPAYVVAYAYTDFFGADGVVQAALRATYGEWAVWLRETYDLDIGRYASIRVRSLEGAAFMLILVLYPYVYLLSRAAFIAQAAGALEVSRTLGVGPWGAAWRVALPMARPAIFTGVALAMMETLADYGVVSFFGVQTLAVGVFRAWHGMGDYAAAAQVSAYLLLFVLLLVTLERIQRRARRFQTARGGYRPIETTKLTGWRAATATVLCAVPVFLGFLLPLAILFWMAWKVGLARVDLDDLRYAANSFSLAAAAAVLTVGLALIIAYAARLRPGPTTRITATVAGLGYALPGGVIAVGVFIPLAAFDNAINAWAEASFGVSTGLILAGSVVALLFAYVVRFMAVAVNTVEAGLAKITPSMDDAARALGEGPGGALRRVHAPMLRGALVTAVLIVFVDVMKELPATMILATDFRTLAVQAHRAASDEILALAAPPSIMIVAVSLAPVLILARELRRSRPGGAAD